MNYYEARVFEGLWYKCTLCDLKSRPSCSDSRATHGSPNMGRFVFVVLELLLFVAGSFSQGGGTSPDSRWLSGRYGHAQALHFCLQQL